KRQLVDILLNWKACRALYHWLIERRQMLKQRGMMTPALWVSRNGGFLCPRAIRNVIKKYMEAAGIESVSPRSLRHTYATHFLVNGGNVQMVKKALGHQRIDTTKVYVELAERAKRAMVQQAVL
ncbi:MAG: tyrosine-type recombinase/integrase, partial [Chloroflexota bacterium]